MRKNRCAALLPARFAVWREMLIFAFMNPVLDFVSRCARWVCRFRHRCGYGVHSPYAFALITGVIYERGEYYAYAPLRRLRTEGDGGLRERDDRLMLRVANASEARRAVVWGRHTATTLRYLAAGRTACAFLHVADGGFGALQAFLADGEGIGLLYVDDPGEWPRVCDACLPHAADGALFVVRGIRRDRASLRAWRRLQADGRVRQTFDLHDFGLACLERRLNKENYIVNYW